MKNFIGSRALPELNYHRPKDVDTLMGLIGSLEAPFKVVAGCTDFIPAVRHGSWTFEDGLNLIDIRGIEALSGIREDGDRIIIGASTRLSEIVDSPLLMEKAPVLSEAVGCMASLQVRNTATIGGNLCMASPAADTAPPLLVLDSQVTIRGVDSEETVPLNRFFLGPGTTRLHPREVLTEISFPAMQANEAARRARLGLRTAFVCSIISVAVRLQTDGKQLTEARVAMGAVAPTPVRLSDAEAFLAGKALNEDMADEAGRIAAAQITPITDLRASAEYRKAMAHTFTRRLLQECLADFKA
ncbi:MAG: xanthine dehydrogenase family protein subunit M [Desulfobacterales bacterium]|jgi:carbon-monoxide dehydrogenase medium subunit